MVPSGALRHCLTAMQGVSASLVSSHELRMALSSRFCRAVANSPSSTISSCCFSSFNKHGLPSPTRWKLLASSAELRCSRGLRLEFARPLSSLLSSRFYSGRRRDPSNGEHSRNGEKGCAALRGGLNGDDGSVKVTGDEAPGGNGITRVQDGRIVPVELYKEVADSYLSYAISVLVGRALPDVRDGLKPVHRRILFAMHELGLSSKKPFKKCARVVGEVLGKFHPHGDTAVYDALVRMAQDFSLRLPLIRGHGNFGSLDADPPAAMRYTECRLQAVSELMLLADLELNTVDFVPNFDGSQQEPSVLPARLPNLLLNGASGIAVGMATNIPPHNMGEVVDALCALIDNPNATVQELMEHLPGPDFPTGGQILGTVGVLEAYRTGRGKLTVRGKAQIEQLDNKSNRDTIIISEIPYQSNKAALVKRMAELVESKILEGISDIRDESDRMGMRIVVEVKRSSNPSVVLNNLYKHTGLQTSFSCNMVGIVNGKPEIVGLKEYLQAFLDFRCSVIERRAAFQLRQAEERDHLVQGILIGLGSLDRVVDIVHGAKTTYIASEALQREFKLSNQQAEALLGMTLRRLTGLERTKFIEEHNALATEISDLKQLLGSRNRILQVVEKESLILKKEFSTPRRTVLEQDGGGELTDIDVISNEEALVMLSMKGYIKRIKPDTFSAQHRGTIGKAGGKLKVDDALSDVLACRAHDYLLFFSEKGTVYSTRAYQIPEFSRTAAGTPLVQVLPVPPGERITSVKSVANFADDQYLVMLTAGGYIKRTPLAAFSAIRSTGIVAIQLVPGDELKWVRLAAEGDTIAIGSRNGYVVRTVCDNMRFRASGRKTRGARSMNLKEGDNVTAMDIVPASVLNVLQEKNTSAPWLLFVTENGFGSRIPLSSFMPNRLNRVGLRGFKFQPGDQLASFFIVGSTLSDDGETLEEVVLGTQGGILNRLKVRDIPERRRFRKGVKLMKLEQGDRINSVSLLSSSEGENNGMPVEQLQAAGR